jgi:hypothetical protein
MRQPEQTSSDVANGSASRTRRSGRAGLLAGAAALAVALTLPAGALAQASFGDPANFAVGDAPLAVATGDFNGDSIQDMAVTNTASDTVSVLLGKGDGTFDAATDYAAGDEPYSVAVDDFNGDEKLDLAVADFASSDPPHKRHLDPARQR